MDRDSDLFESKPCAGYLERASCEGVVAGFDQTIKLRFADGRRMCGWFYLAQELNYTLPANQRAMAKLRISFLLLHHAHHPKHY